MTDTATTERMAALARTYSTRAEDEARLDDAIARRNTAWAHYESAAAMLRAATAAGRPEETLRQLRQNYNACQTEWEHAVRDLTRERRAFQIATSEHWKPR